MINSARLSRGRVGRKLVASGSEVHDYEETRFGAGGHSFLASELTASERRAIEDSIVKFRSGTGGHSFLASELTADERRAIVASRLTISQREISRAAAADKWRAEHVLTMWPLLSAGEVSELYVAASGRLARSTAAVPAIAGHGIIDVGEVMEKSAPPPAQPASLTRYERLSTAILEPKVLVTIAVIGFSVVLSIIRSQMYLLPAVVLSGVLMSYAIMKLGGNLNDAGYNRDSTGPGDNF